MLLLLLPLLLKRKLPAKLFLPHHGRQEAAAAGSRILELQQEAGSEAGSCSRKKLRGIFFLTERLKWKIIQRQEEKQLTESLRVSTAGLLP